MQIDTQPDRRVNALVVALSLNRGEIDAASLTRLLRLLETTAPPKPAAS
jgi:hypothetical protein